MEKEQQDVYAKQPKFITDFIHQVNKAGMEMVAKLHQHERALSNLTRAKDSSNDVTGRQDDECDMPIDVFLEKFGYSEAELARALNVIPQQVQNWKKAKEPICIRVGLRQMTVDVIRVEKKLNSCLLPSIGAGV